LEGSNLTDNQFLYIDIGVLVPLCIFQSYTGAYEKLTQYLPQETLFSPVVLTSVIGMGMIQAAFQFLVYFRTETMLGDKFIKCTSAEDVEDDDPPCSNNTVLYLVSSMQYLFCCLALSVSKPFRKSITTN
jgi:cation-transporting ATPase 13A3/4/5